eukprot:TRINITY_DN1501_c0_g1_i1.p1 TRINITY_DN1501_c0_g1~~TRINITY_DN1501_c0_g1_i1.p1  ORF type:complete len:304 (-),score=73.66 TRINITY_DN1501_c0_g1_i1:60-971(-)
MDNHDEIGDSIDYQYPECADERRMIEKWKEVLLNPKKFDSQYLRNLVLKGLPNGLRGEFYYYFGGGRSLKRIQPGLFQKYSNSIPEKDKEIIDVDVDRTFPTHPLFSSETSSVSARQALRTILYAYSSIETTIGYTQGMSTIAGLFLLFLPIEDSFYVFTSLIDSVFSDLYSESMQQIQSDSKVLLQLIENKCNSTAKTIIQHLKIPFVFIAIRWFLSGFTYCIPFSYCIRLLDLIVLDGFVVFFKASIVLVDTLKKCPSSVNPIHWLQTVPVERLFTSQEFLKLVNDVDLTPLDIANIQREL